MKSPAAHKIIAIDGPAASGKSSVARELARRLDFVYVNSGAMYRAMTWLVLERSIPPNDARAIERLAETRPDYLRIARSRLSHVDRRGRSRAVPPRRSRQRKVSLVSSVPRVREILVDHLRRYARGQRSGDGRSRHWFGRFSRDPFKFYIDASPDIGCAGAKRRDNGTASPRATRPIPPAALRH